MIICVCRNIKESDFNNQEDLIKRVKQPDHNCGQCLQFVKDLSKSKDDKCV